MTEVKANNVTLTVPSEHDDVPVTSSSSASTESDAIEDDAISNSDWRDYVPQPPDGGWGWVVMAASFCNNFILDGIAYSFGAFLTEYVYYFNSTVSATSFANALLCGVYLLVGPLVGALVNKYGCRAIGVTGSLLGAVAFLASAASPSLGFMTFTYGLIGGIAFGMMYLPAVVSVGYYFDKKRAMATGIAVCGTGIGTFCMAPFAKILLEEYNWKNAHIILSGLVLQGCISSSLMRPLPTKWDAEKKDIDSKNKSKGILKCLRKLCCFGAEDTSASQVSQKLHASVYMSKTHIISKQDLSRPLYRQDIFLSAHNLSSSKQITTVRSTRTIPSCATTQTLASTLSIPEVKAHGWSCFSSLPKPAADILAEMMDPSILKNKGMLLLSAANIIGMIGFYVPIIFAAPRAEVLGVNPTKAAFLMSIMGICNTVGRVFSGIISSIPHVSPLLVNNISITLAGVAVSLMPLCTTYETMGVVMAASGLFLSTYVSLASTILCELVGLEKLTNGFGLLCMVRGVTAIAGPPFEGWLYDFTGSYDLTFFFGGACLILSGLMHFLLHTRCFKNVDESGVNVKRT